MTTEELLRRNAERKRAAAQEQVRKQRARLGLDVVGAEGGGGRGGGSAEHTRGGGRGAETLTEKFNAASMADLAKLSKSDAQVAELKRQVRETLAEFNRKSNQQGIDGGPVRPASRLVAEQLEQQRAQMRPTHTPSPTGTILNTFDPKKERVLSHEIKRIHTQLDRQHGVAMDAFNKEAKQGLCKGF